MTWKEAIRKVLQEEGGPLHYTDITSRIFENGYRKKEECGATPDQTVCAQLATKKDMFLKYLFRTIPVQHSGDTRSLFCE